MKMKMLKIKGIPTLFVDHLQDKHYDYIVKSAVNHVIQYLSSKDVSISRNTTLVDPLFIEYFCGLSTRLLFSLTRADTSYVLELCTGKVMVYPKNVGIRRSICTLKDYSLDKSLDLFGTDAEIYGNIITFTNKNGIRVNLFLDRDIIDMNPCSISSIKTSQVRCDRVKTYLNLDTSFDNSVFNTLAKLNDIHTYVETYGTKKLEHIVDYGYKNAMYFDSDYYKYVGILTVQCTPSSCFVYDSSLDK